MRHPRVVAALLTAGTLGACSTPAQQPPKDDTLARLEVSQQDVPMPPWPAGDERGMGNTQGSGTRMRCGVYLLNPHSREYELSYVRSRTMPMSPFATPVQYTYQPTFGPPFSRHAVNGEVLSGEPGGQGTQIDALGHFGVLPEVWDPSTGPLPSQNAVYYSGYTQAQVKPTPDSPLLKLGVEKMPPIVTSAVLLDARTYLGGGNRLAGGQRITAADINGMIQAQELGWRGLLPGDVLYIYTGWEELWQDPNVTGEYYAKGPGLSADAAKLLAEKAIVAVGLDVPFIDAVNEGQLQGKAPPPPGTPAGFPFYVHSYALSQAGIHLLENVRLKEMATDKTWLSCTMVLALRELGGSGSPVRSVSYGPPRH
ncbi:MAG TPA: cyclase family protein [Archangium sp.]|uniref:cyclase family protein n=1 Tax=Archangium sp. TaxID=1872627 RepID=UPI002ED82FAB